MLLVHLYHAYMFNIYRVTWFIHSAIDSPKHLEVV